MPYRGSSSSMLLTPTGTWSFIAIAICGCCAAVAFLRQKDSRERSVPFTLVPERGRRKKSSSGRPSELQIVYRRGSPSFRWDQVGIEQSGR
jgi:hypothetical protein